MIFRVRWAVIVFVWARAHGRENCHAYLSWRMQVTPFSHCYLLETIYNPPKKNKWPSVATVVTMTMWTVELKQGHVRCSVFKFYSRPWVLLYPVTTYPLAHLATLVEFRVWTRGFRITSGTSLGAISALWWAEEWIFFIEFHIHLITF